MSSKKRSINPSSRLLQHTVSSASRKLSTMEAHPNAFKTKRVSFDSAHSTALAMRENLSSLNPQQGSTDAKRLGMTYDFETQKPNAQYYKRQNDSSSPSHSAALMSTLDAPPPDVDNGPGELENHFWLNSALSTERGSGRELVKHAELLAKGKGFSRIALAAFDSKDHWERNGFSDTGHTQTEDDDGEIYTYPVLSKRPTPSI